MLGWCQKKSVKLFEINAPEWTDEKIEHSPDFFTPNMKCVTCLSYEIIFFESRGAKISSTEEQQKYNLVKIRKKTWLKSGKSGKITHSTDFTWIENLCWTFHYISELFNHINVHISSTGDVRLMPKKIRETFRKSTRPTLRVRNEEQEAAREAKIEGQGGEVTVMRGH